jgi:hypothetical protein
LAGLFTESLKETVALYAGFGCPFAKAQVALFRIPDAFPPEVSEMSQPPAQQMISGQPSSVIVINHHTRNPEGF